MDAFRDNRDAPLIAGRCARSGPRVLLLHRGPGLGFDYVCDPADELAGANTVLGYPSARAAAPAR